MKRALAALALLAASSAAPAWQLDRVDVGYDGVRYRIDMDVRLAAPRDRAFAVFSDFSNLPRINDAVELAQVLPPPAPGTTRLSTIVRVCVTWYCRHMHQVNDIVRDDGDGVLGLEATVIPRLSDLKEGHARWSMRDCGGLTCLHFDADLIPDFWVPPLLGPWLIQRKMRNEAVETSSGIERLARDGAH